jgi:hypothetical protein
MTKHIPSKRSSKRAQQRPSARWIAAARITGSNGQLTIHELGQGEFCYVRQSLVEPLVVVFRFESQAEVDAAMECGMALDHVQGTPPHLVEAIQAAARRARG